MDRKPPVAVRRKLREEVGFCCPIEDCGSPYLTYHHFDPPWATEAHHNPEGMIALCLQHHKEADGGDYTDIQLLELKEAGKNNKPVSGQFNWKRENTLIIAGSNYFIGSPTILEANKTKQIWFEKDEKNNDTVNMDLYSSDGLLVFQMRKNDWTVLPDFEDIESPPSARSLKIRSRKYGVSVDLEFSNQDINKITKIVESNLWNGTLKSVEEYNQILPDDIIPRKEFKDELEKSVSRVTEYVSKNLGESGFMTCLVNLSIKFPVSLQLTPKKLQMQVDKSSFTFSGCLMGSVTVLSI